MFDYIEKVYAILLLDSSRKGRALIHPALVQDRRGFAGFSREKAANQETENLKKMRSSKEKAEVAANCDHLKKLKYSSALEIVICSATRFVALQEFRGLRIPIAGIFQKTKVLPGVEGWSLKRSKAVVHIYMLKGGE